MRFLYYYDSDDSFDSSGEIMFCRFRTLFHHLCVIQENQNIREGCYEENYTRFRNVCLSQKFNNKVETQTQTRVMFKIVFKKNNKIIKTSKNQY